MDKQDILFDTPLNLKKCVENGLIKQLENGTYSDPYDVEGLIKDKSRVKDSGEVYTPAHIVKDMLDMSDKALFNADGSDDSWNFFNYVNNAEDNVLTDYVGKTYLEPSCGNGNFLVQILDRKVYTSLIIYSRHRDESEFNKNLIKCFTTIYGVDIKGDNIIEAKNRLYIQLLNSLKKYGCTVDAESDYMTRLKAVVYFVMNRNIQLGNTLDGGYYRDGKEELYNIQVARTKRETKSVETGGFLDDFFSNTSDTEYPEFTVNRKLSNGKIETQAVYMLITNWIFKDDAIYRETIKFNELSKDDAEQEKWHTIEDRLPIRYGHMLEDVRAAELAEGETSNVYSGSSDSPAEGYEETESSSSVDSDEDIDEDMTEESTGIEGFMNPPIDKPEVNVDKPKVNKPKAKKSGVSMLTNW